MRHERRVLSPLGGAGVGHHFCTKRDIRPTIVIYDTLSAAKFDPGNGEWMSEAGELGKGLQASRTLIPHRAKDVSLRVMNLMDTEERLGKGTAMAE